MTYDGQPERVLEPVPDCRFTQQREGSVYFIEEETDGLLIDGIEILDSANWPPGEEGETQRFD